MQNVTAGTTSVPSNAEPFPAVQNNGDVHFDVSNLTEQQQQPQNSSTFASTSTLPPGGGGGMPEQQHLQLQPMPPLCGFSKDCQKWAQNNNKMESGSRNRGNNSNNENITINNDNKVDEKCHLFKSSEENPTHNVTGITPNQRSLSEASFGSFSMGEEDMSESGADLGNLSVHNNITTPGSHIHESALPPEKSTEMVTQSARVNNHNTTENRSKHTENNQTERRLQLQTALIQQGEPHRLSPPSSTTTENNTKTEHTIGENNKRNNSISDENNDQLNRYKTNNIALRPIQSNQRAEMAHTIQAFDNTGQTRDVHIPQSQTNLQQYQHKKRNNEEVIELLDDGAETDAGPNTDALATSGIKRSRPQEVNNSSKPIVPGSSLHGYQSNTHQYAHSNNFGAQSSRSQSVVNNNTTRRLDISSEPQYISLPPNYIPTWDNPLPPLLRQPPSHSNRYKHFELSLLNVSEFTITGLPVTLDGRPSSVSGFRKIVKEVSRGHGKCIFERDNPKENKGKGNSNIPSTFTSEQYSSYGEHENPDGGKWRLPLGAYRAFYSYLKSDSMCKVRGIPEDQLKIASLGKARMEKGFPSAKKIISYGVPNGLATALAPFQRGGVEFVVEKGGRALIADDMGLGKTIQSIASMSVYHEEWPLLILTPSSARYHWAAEFNNWLGFESPVNEKKDGTRIPNNPIEEGEEPDPFEEEDNNLVEPRKSMQMLKEMEIHVMLAGKEKIFPSTETRIVICSYGLATSLVESGKLHAGLFRCAIVDESHMLKNMKTKRTSKLVPILHATNRCILLSGTPALARPTELWPQLKILSTERDGWWDDEAEFIRKYVQRTSAIRRAELHTMLTGTVMIRRMKHDMLKSLPSKQREKALVDVVTPEIGREFHNCMKLLREGKGVMAKIAKRHPVVPEKEHEVKINPIKGNGKKLESLKAEYSERYRQKIQSIRFEMQSVHMEDEEKENLMAAYFNKAKAEVDIWYNERMHELDENPQEEAKKEELDRKTILNKMYSMTAKAKIPLIAELVGKWLDDPTKGKLCIFAHHIYVLDEIVRLVGLSNTQNSRKRFIRIDGSTPPKERQAQIMGFQNDPDIRIAVLGITAAGVAVTLTASSTVWFTELFWTPALMIQAEDRCHRIGQNAAVKCLYFVATGTLDVLLWDLLEKKFQDLGEFVEGKEKMKMAVQHTFKSVKELQSIFVRPGDDGLDEDTKQNENESATEGNDLIKLENDLQDDIVQLAHEEMFMISQGEDEDIAENKSVGKHMREENPAQSKLGLGQTEDEAICLSDDEDDTTTRCEDVKNESDNKSSPSGSGGENGFCMSKSRVLHKCRFYKQYFEGSSYGIQLLYVGDRLAVADNRFGKLKPALGDILVAVNGYRLPLACPLDNACRYMKQLVNKGTVELTFVEDEEFLKHYSHFILETRQIIKANGNQSSNKKPRNPPGKSAEDVIEILDDD